MAPKVFAVVLNYRRHQDTISCIEALQNTDAPKGLQIVCVDNSGDDKSFSVLKKRFSKVHLIKAGKNLGFAGGNNLGIKYALTRGATHILIINPDVQVGPVFFAPLLKVFQTKSRAGLTAPALKHQQNGKTFLGLEGKIDWRTAKATHLNVSRLTDSSPRPAQFVTFACVLIKAEVFSRVGFLDDGYFMYLEDVDYCLSVRQRGYSIFLNPAVIVSHQTSSSFRRPTDKLLLSFKSQIRFINKWLKFPKNIFPLVYAILFYPYLYLLWTYFDIKKKLLQ